MKVFAVLLVSLATVSSQIFDDEVTSAVSIIFQTIFGPRTCYGTLLSPNFLITCADCCFSAYMAEVYAGNNGEVQKRVPASSFTTNLLYNIALIRVDLNPVSVNITYPTLYNGTVEQQQGGTYVTWGSAPLQTVGVTLMPMAICNGLIPNLLGSRFCTNECVNRPGAGFMVDGQLAGLVSTRLGSCPPGVYANVASLRSYITQITGL